MKSLIFCILTFASSIFGADSTKVVDGKFTAYAKGATIVDGIFYNGVQFMGVSGYARTPEEVVLKYMTSPSVRDYVAGTLRWGVTPTNTWVNIYDDTLKVTNWLGSFVPVKAGTVITVKTGDGFTCGYGKVGVGGKLIFLPVYGKDQYSSLSGGGPLPGENIYVYLGGVEPLVPISGIEIIWTSNGDRIKLPDMILVTK